MKLRRRSGEPMGAKHSRRGPYLAVTTTKEEEQVFSFVISHLLVSYNFPSNALGKDALAELSRA